MHILTRRTSYKQSLASLLSQQPECDDDVTITINYCYIMAGGGLGV